MKFKRNSYSINVGLRLFAAAVFVVLAQLLGMKGMEEASVVSFFAAILAMFIPTPGVYNKRTLAVGATDTEEYEEKLMDKIKKTVQDLNEKAFKEAITEKQMEKALKALNKEVADLSAEAMGKLDKDLKEMAIKAGSLETKLAEATEALKAQGVELKKITDNATKTDAQKQYRSFREAMKAALEEDGKHLLVDRDDEYGKRKSMQAFFKKGGSHANSGEITIKAAIDLFESTALDAEVPQLRLTALDPNRVGIPLNPYLHVVNTMQTKTIVRPYMALLVVHTYWDGVAVKAEGVALAQSSFKFKTVKFPAFVIGTYFGISDEALDDMDEFLDEVSKVAPDKVNESIDVKVLGTAGDDVADIKGIRTVGATGKSTAYVTTFGAASIDGAYIVDVIADANMQANNANYIANVVYLNPLDVKLLAAKKNTLDDPMRDNRVVYGPTGEATYVDGLRIIKTRSITANQFVIADSNLPWLGIRKDLVMEIGYNGTDFIEGQRTIKMSTRLAFGVRDKAGIIWCADIAAAIAIINK